MHDNLRQADKNHKMWNVGHMISVDSVDSFDSVDTSARLIEIINREISIIPLLRERI